MTDAFTKVASRDGTPIGCWRSGDGPALVLVHGSTADHTRWDPLLPSLKEQFTVYAVDRRGRGESGDVEPYALEREFEDIAAVVDSVGSQVFLLGHSYGALCSMEAALRTDNLRKLVLYEPPFPVNGVEMYEPAARERLEALLATGDRELLVTTFFAEVVKMPPEEIASLRSKPSWQARLAAAHTLVRELSDADYLFDPARFEALGTPTLLLVGENSPPFLKLPTEQLASVLPNCRVVSMPGQGHAAMNTAPELFLREVIGFLSE